MSSLPDLRRKVNKKLSELAVCREQCRRDKAAMDAATDRREAIRSALTIAQGVATSIQQHAHKRVADIVSRSLEAVFDEPYQFKLKFEERRGRTEAALIFERDGMEIDPMTASGGGVVDVAAFALRLSYLLLSQPPLRRLIVLDEPFKFLSREYIERARDLVMALAKELDCQFVIVTHHDELKIGHVVKL